MTIESDSLVVENIYEELRYGTSRSEHVIFWLNMGGPSSNPKYYLQIDSEQVPWGKGEKYPDKGSETVPETECLQAVGASLRGDRVPFV